MPGAGGRPLKVSDVASLALEPGPANIDRYNRQRQISLNGNLDGIPMQSAVNAVQEKVDEMHLKPGYAAVFGFSARMLSQASSDFLVAVILAVIFIYMVLASQFNSFIHPLTIMTAIPLSLPCGLFALMIFGMTVNVYSAIGLMMLFGIVKKNSILQVDYTNTLIAQGMERNEAIMHGESRPSPADSDDHDCDRRRHAADRFRERRGIRIPRIHGGHDHRRPGALPSADAAGDSGHLFALR